MEYKTPGVYVEEISVFPPSVAAVDTAVPAFIGYVSKAEKRGESLFVPASGPTPAIIKPTKVTSLPEFEAYFGKGPQRTHAVVLDSTDEIVSTTSSTSYQLYDNIKMFYLNGGGKCYIVPVGFFGESGIPVQADIEAGLTVLRKVDEPTLIVIPDAVSLAGTGQFEVYVQAMQQCADLKDRFTICDLQNVNGLSHDQVVENFRNNIGINNLKYGASYTPWLKSTLPRDLHYRDIGFEREGTGTPINLFDMTTDVDIRMLISDLESAITQVDFIESTLVGTPDINTQLTNFVDDINTAMDAYDPVAGTNSGDIATAEVRDLYNAIRDLMFAIIDFRDNQLPAVIVPPVVADPLANETYDFILATDINNAIVARDIANSFATLLHHSNAHDLGAATDIFTAGGSNLADVAAALGLGVGDTDVDVTNLYPVATTPAEAVEVATLARNAALSVIPNFVGLVSSILDSARSYESTFESTLEEVFGFYKNSIIRITEDLSLLPPSATIAGIYASVDASRGVHKAPANVSITGANGLAFTIDNQEQEGLNVDANAGKSINAIRSFTGKGILVWGARTLAGNDNEWRYINVKRFYNFAEESIKKAVEQFVFESNDANTWTKIKALISNFLTVQWRSGALAGAKPAHAFFVKVGLGETMTALDILEGRMIVEIGLAVVRPAEFIILRFSHKMQES
ncbi:phage tail sheath family protein [Maribacter sp. 2307UL18-2]|uniref:phage tail sheath family protein n=1 Tax=Maribacter sp. 2307UL18-2 TaxID=3386274 RepID=UPI0039BD4B5D